MTVETPPPFLTRVQKAWPSYHASERRLAEAILNFPGQLASYNAGEIAQMAGVSNATMTRFIRKIGYASFEDARQAVRDDQEAGGALLRAEMAGGTASDVITAHLEQSRASLEATFAQLEATELDAAVDAMVGARRLSVFGFRAGQPFARYLGWQVGQALSHVDVLPRDGETLAEALAPLGPKDCAVVVLLRRVPAAAVTLCDALDRTGADVILIGDVPDLAERPGRWHFHCRTASGGTLFDHTGVMALCNLLAVQVIDRAGPESRSKMRVIETFHDKMGEL